MAQSDEGIFLNSRQVKERSPTLLTCGFFVGYTTTAAFLNQSTFAADVFGVWRT